MNLARRHTQAFVVGCGVTLAAIVLPVTAARADESYAWEGHPANFYKLVEQVDSTVCPDVLKSLNKRNALHGEDSTLENPNLYGDALLRSDLEVPWKKRILKFDVIKEGLSYVRVPLASAGKPVSIFRWEFTDSRGSQSELAIYDGALPELSDEHSDPTALLQKVLGEKAKNEVKLHKEALWDRGLSTTEPFLLNVISLRGRVFVLATGAFEVTHRMERGRGKIHLFVLELHSREDLPLVCEFRGGGANR